MPSTSYESTDLLSLFNTWAGRPATDTMISDPTKYQYLSRAQNRVIALMSGVVPYSLYPKVAYGSLPTLTTTDGGYTFTFGTDSAGYPTFPMGKGGIFTSLADIPSNPLRPGIDYMQEGYQIRWPNDVPYTGTLYWYGVGQPADITAVVQPSLFPEASRELIVIEAVRQFASYAVRSPELVATMEREWNGDPERGLPGQWAKYCLMWKTQFRTGGALNCWSGLNIAIAGSGGWNNNF